MPFSHYVQVSSLITCAWVQPKVNHILIRSLWTGFALFSLMGCSVMVSGNTKFADGLRTYLLSRDYLNLKSELQNGNGKVGPHFYRNLCFLTPPTYIIGFGWHRSITMLKWITRTHCVAVTLAADNGRLHWKYSCREFRARRTCVFDSWGLILNHKIWEILIFT